jgi:hypothetical protein
MRLRPALCALLCSLLLLTGCTVWRERPVVNTWKEATGGESLERSFWKEVHDKNWNELSRHIGGNYISITPSGRFDRATSIERLQQIQLDDYSLGDFQVELNANTLVVTYTLTSHGTVAGQPFPSQPVRIMAVWQQEKAGWMKIAHTVTQDLQK